MVTKKVKLSFEVDVEVETDEFEEDFNDFENLMKNFALARLQVVERPDGSEEDSAYNEYVDGYIDLFSDGEDEEAVEKSVEQHWDKLKILDFNFSGEIVDD